MSPTQRTLKTLREAGYKCAVVEHYNAYAKKRQDLFGIIDVVGMCDELPGLIGVQTTTASNMAARVKKALANDYLKTWIRSGNFFVVHGWAKKNGRYQLSVRGIHLHNGKLKVGTELEPEIDDGDENE